MPQRLWEQLDSERTEKRKATNLVGCGQHKKGNQLHDTVTRYRRMGQSWRRHAKLLTERLLKKCKAVRVKNKLKLKLKVKNAALKNLKEDTFK